MEIYKKLTATKLGAITITITQINNNMYEAMIQIEALAKTYTSTQPSVRDAFLWLYGAKQYLNDSIASYALTEDYTAFLCKGATHSKEVVYKIAQDVLDAFTLPTGQKQVTVANIAKSVAKLSAEDRAKLLAELQK